MNPFPVPFEPSLRVSLTCSSFRSVNLLQVTLNRKKKNDTEKNAIGEENKIHLATAAAVLSHGRLWDTQTLIAWRYVFLEGKYVSKAWWELLQFWSSTYQILNSIAFFYMLYT